MTGESSVGYGRPPKQHQFKKGQSGNPRGRPSRRPKVVSEGEILRMISNESITVQGENGPIVMPRWEALLRQLTNMAINRNPGAANLLHRMRSIFRPQSDPIVVYFTEQDMALL